MRGLLATGIVAFGVVARAAALAVTPVAIVLAVVAVALAADWGVHLVAGQHFAVRWQPLRVHRPPVPPSASAPYALEKS